MLFMPRKEAEHIIDFETNLKADNDLNTLFSEMKTNSPEENPRKASEILPDGNILTLHDQRNTEHGHTGWRAYLGSEGFLTKRNEGAQWHSVPEITFGDESYRRDVHKDAISVRPQNSPHVTLKLVKWLVDSREAGKKLDFPFQLNTDAWKGTNPTLQRGLKHVRPDSRKPQK